MVKINNKIRVFIIVLSLLCFCFSITGCSKNNSNRTDTDVKTTDFTNIEKEYLEELQKLNWPEGYSLPTKLEGEVADQFQVGYGVTRASMLWECAWQKEWLEYYKKDSKRAENAIKELEKAPDMLYMSPEKCDDATRKYFKDNLDKAKLGDPSGFEQNVRLNCPEK